MASSKTAILVVEDELAIQRGLCDVLAFHGYQPTGVGTGEEGLKHGRSGQYQLVILDIMLPGVNGFDVCEQLRDVRVRVGESIVEPFQDLPVFDISNYLQIFFPPKNLPIYVRLEHTLVQSAEFHQVHRLLKRAL